ncbi:MAG: nitroreductase [Rhodobacteraceae bacterium]|nr:nitroreductase [Paracoccaceae bacterium]
MLTPNPAALEFLLTRRSRPAKTLRAPAPDRAALDLILQAGARAPDHGAVEPWRFIVLQGTALQRLAGEVEARALALHKPQEQVDKARNTFANAPLVVAVVASPRESGKVPQIKQTLSAGAVSLSLLNAALAAGWGANWVTGWAAYDRVVLGQILELEDHEFVADFVRIGTESAAPADRKRPDLSVITQWVTE